MKTEKKKKVTFKKFKIASLIQVNSIKGGTVGAGKTELRNGCTDPGALGTRNC